MLHILVQHLNKNRFLRLKSPHIDMPFFELVPVFSQLALALASVYFVHLFSEYVNIVRQSNALTTKLMKDRFTENEEESEEEESEEEEEDSDRDESETSETEDYGTHDRNDPDSENSPHASPLRRTVRGRGDALARFVEQLNSQEILKSRGRGRRRGRRENRGISLGRGRISLGSCGPPPSFLSMLRHLEVVGRGMDSNDNVEECKGDNKEYKEETCTGPCNEKENCCDASGCCVQTSWNDDGDTYDMDLPDLVDEDGNVDNGDKEELGVDTASNPEPENPPEQG
jgi:hypothetical protein